MTLATVFLFGQALLAGQFLSGAYRALDLHRANAFLAEVMVVISAVGAFVDARARGGPRWPPLVCTGLVVAVGVQIRLGLNRELAVHIPLGVAIIATAALLLQEAWRTSP
ncbi:MAG TPA: hypothetical protein VMU14_10340 [Acidimicrobiales bacterium]|nr:hypothetical protein [Acidimicrobiales bacterium]